MFKTFPRPFARHALASAALVALAPFTTPALAVDYLWTGGDYTPGVTSPNPLGAGDQLLIGSGSFKLFNNVAFTNTGSVRWLADTVYIQAGAAVTNNGLWDSQADTTLQYNGGAGPSFTNNGIFRKSGGTGDTTVGQDTGFINNGVLDAQTGSIRFQGGSTFNAGSSFTGAGRVAMVGGTNTFNGVFTSASLVLENGYFNGNNAVVGGTVAFTGGALTGLWEVAAGQTLTAQDGAFKYIDGAATVLTNKGTVDWATGNALYMQAGGKLSNQALFLASANTTLIYNGGASTTFDNTALGTVRAAAGVTLTISNIDFVNNGGTLEALAGGLINHVGGSSRFNDGTRFIGAGSNVVSSNATFSGGFQSANLELRGGVFTGNNAVLGGSVAFTGGRLEGTWEVAAGQTLRGLDGGFKYISNDGVLTNKGTVDWSTGNLLYMEGGGKLSNQALFVANANTTVAYNGGATATFDNTAAGTVRAAAGVTLNIGAIDFVNNGGTLEALAGGSINHVGGSSRFNDGTRFTGAGSNVVSNNAVFSGGFQSQNLELQSGTFTGNSAVVGGTAVLTGGRLAGTWTVAAGQTLRGQDGGFKYVVGEGSVLTNKGTVAWDTSNALYLESGAAVVNQGTWDFQRDGAILYNGGSSPSLLNQGLIVKTGGAGTATVGDNIGFDNQGTVDVRSGAITLPGNFANNGVLTGSGAFNVGGTLANAGHVAPGVGAGTLTLNGAYAQAAGGFFDVDLGTLGASDRLLVNGAASLGGTLALHCFAACSYAIGDEIVVLDATGDLSGSFAAVTLSGFETGAFNVLYDTIGDRVLLQVTEAVTAAVPEPETYAMLLSGLAVLGFVARRRRAHSNNGY